MTTACRKVQVVAPRSIEVPHPVLGHERVDALALREFSDELAQEGIGGRMADIVDAGHRLAVIVVADHSGEGDDRTGPLREHLGIQLIRVDIDVDDASGIHHQLLLGAPGRA